MHRIQGEADAAAWLADQRCACDQRKFVRDPVLVDAETPRLRFAGCEVCHEPAYVDAALPAELEGAIGGDARLPRALDPDVIVRLKPWVEAAFPAYAGSRADAIDTSSAPLGPEWTISEWLRGSLDYGQARCVRRDGVRALATFSGPQTQSLDAVTAKLKLTARGIAPMLDLRTAGDHVVLFEQEPAGVPLATPMFPLHVDAAAMLLGRLLDIVVDAHARGELVRGLRPETIYIGRDGVVGLAPRGELFAGGARQSRDLSPAYPFPAMYQPPDMMSGKATAASDVFACCAVLLFALTRRPPYDAPSPAWQLGAMMSGPPALPPSLDPRFLQLVRAGLDPDPAKRPSAVEVSRALAAS